MNPETVYLCDPEKNVNCSKTGCVHSHNCLFPVCRCTTDPKYAQTDELGNPIVASREEYDFPKPSPIYFDVSMDQRMCQVHSSNYREDCYWHTTDIDMHATVHCCTAKESYGYGQCPCSDDCHDYISKSEVREIVKKLCARKE